MKWRTVRVPECDSQLSEPCRQDHGKLIVALNALLEKRRDIDARSSAANGVVMTRAAMSEIDELRYARVSALQDEIDLRNRLREWCPRNREELRKLTEVVHNEKTAAMEEVQAKLVGIGFAPYTEHRSVRNRIEDHWLFRHPTVHERELRVQHVRNLFNSNHDLNVLNDQETGAALQEMEGHRTSLSTV